MIHKAQLSAVVLAAGAGSRLEPITRRIPKPLAPVANRPVIEHIFRLLKKHGINSVCANLHHLAEKIPAHFKNVKDLDMTINYVTEEKLSGDAGGVRACRQHLGDGTFLVMMGDALTDIDLTKLIESHKKSKAIATIALKQVADVTQFGVVKLDDNGNITAFQEKPKADEAFSNLASTGIYVFEPEIFNHIPAEGEFGFGKQLFPLLLELGIPIHGEEVACYWSDIGTIASYTKASFDVLDGLVQLEFAGDLVDKDSAVHASLKLEGELMVGHGVILGDGITVKGHAIIGDNCMIGSGVVLEDAIIWANSTVAANSQIKRAIVVDGTHLRSYSRWADVGVVAEALPGQAPKSATRIVGRAKSKKAFAS